MKKFLSLFLFTFFLGTTLSHAALLIEPLIGFNTGFKSSVKNGEDYNKGNGPGFGGRLGYQNFGLQLGIDYLRSTIDLNDKDFKNNMKVDEWAAFAGFKFPLFLRVYAGYIFSAMGTGQFNGGSGTNYQDFQARSGTGSKFGISFTGIPLLNLNFEYRRGNFGEYKLGSNTVKDDINYSVYFVSLSLPLTF